MIFKNPLLLLLVPIVLAIVFWCSQRSRQLFFRFPSHKLWHGLNPTWRIQFIWIPCCLRIVAIILFVVALAGPRSVLEETIYKTDGIDIVLSIDASGSMAAEDFVIDRKRVNRLQIVKNVVREFVNERRYDRIGLVAFAGLAYTVCPLSTDYEWLTANLDRIELGLIQDGTAIGSAIVASLSRLEESESRSKVVILLTDGVNNAGNVAPIAAAQAAAKYGIKIYTIGAGTNGSVPYPTTDFFGRRIYQDVVIELDEATLQKVAEITGGKYFRATDSQSLRAIYQEIDKLEKTEVEQIGYFEYKELFGYLILAALILIGIELLLANTVFMKIP